MPYLLKTYQARGRFHGLLTLSHPDSFFKLGPGSFLEQSTFEIKTVLKKFMFITGPYLQKCVILKEIDEESEKKRRKTIKKSSNTNTKNYMIFGLTVK